MEATNSALLIQAINNLVQPSWYQYLSIGNLVVLFFTGITVFWYTRETRALAIETRRLRKWAASENSILKQQLKIEQTPYVVLDHIRKHENRFGFAIKNIGRGPAVSVTFSKSDNISIRNEPFFSNDQPHSVNLMSQEESHYWVVDNNVLENLHFENSFANLNIFFENQFSIWFRTKVKIKSIIKSGGVVEYTVMENQFEELGREVGR